MTISKTQLLTNPYYHEMMRLIRALALPVRSASLMDVIVLTGYRM